MLYGFLILSRIDIDAIAVPNIFAVYLHGGSCHWGLSVDTNDSVPCICRPSNISGVVLFISYY